MTHLILLVLATYWAWQTLRYAVENLYPPLFTMTRFVHPLIVASLPLYVLWPEWVAALGVAGATAILVGVNDHLFSSAPGPTYIPRRRDRGGLPPLP